jgi:hypothetical protein
VGAAPADEALLATDAGALAAGASGARDEALAAAAAASPGALGPGRIPANRGQATPMAKPTTAMTPTLTQLGLSELAGGIWTVSGEELRPIIAESRNPGGKRGFLCSRV